MKWLAIFLFAFASVGTAEAGILGWLTSKRVDWQFVQNTGGIRISPVREVEGKKCLPVEYDASGLTTITRKPTTMNSGLVVRKVVAARKDRSIVIQVITQAADDERQVGGVHLADLSGIPPGSYEVFYESAGDAEKHLGHIELK